MTRRPAGPLLPRGERSGGARGFGGGNLPLLAVGGGAVVLLAVLIFLVAGRCSSARAADPDCTKKAPAPPQGYAYASKYCVSTKLVGQPVDLKVPLSDRSASRGLSVFSYDGGKWNRLAAAQVIENGSLAENATAIKLPKTYAVLRRAGGDFQILGELPPGAFASADAGRLVSAIVPATYTPAADGSISGGPLALPQGANYPVSPAISAQSGAEAQAVNAILGDETRRTTHIDRIAAEADKGGYDSIVIDYAVVDTGLKANFTTFVQALATKLHAGKHRLVVRLPLPRRDGSNWNVGAYDWTALGKAADSLVMAVERDQSIYRTRVPEAVKYLTSQVEPRKLVLEITPLAEERSEQGTVRSLTTAEALSIAGQITVRDRDKVVTGADVTVSADNINRENGSGPQWTAQGVVSFSYRAAEDQRTVWIENVYSVGYKLEIVQLYKLGGVAVDNASADPRITNIWSAIEQYQAAGAPVLQAPNPQTLRPQWLADGKPIPDAGTRAVITWRAPSDPGKHTLAVIVSDGTLRVTNSTDVDVRAGTPGTGGGTPGPSGTPGARFTPIPTRSPATPTRVPTR